MFHVATAPVSPACSPVQHKQYTTPLNILHSLGWRREVIISKSNKLTPVIISPHGRKFMRFSTFSKYFSSDNPNLNTAIFKTLFTITREESCSTRSTVAPGSIPTAPSSQLSQQTLPPSHPLYKSAVSSILKQTTLLYDDKREKIETAEVSSPNILVSCNGMLVLDSEVELSIGFEKFMDESEDNDLERDEDLIRILQQAWMFYKEEAGFKTLATPAHDIVGECDRDPGPAQHHEDHTYAGECWTDFGFELHHVSEYRVTMSKYYGSTCGLYNIS